MHSSSSCALCGIETAHCATHRRWAESCGTRKRGSGVGTRGRANLRCRALSCWEMPDCGQVLIVRSSPSPLHAHVGWAVAIHQGYQSYTDR
jgi:hypothetical protein